MLLVPTHWRGRLRVYNLARSQVTGQPVDGNIRHNPHHRTAYVIGRPCREAESLPRPCANVRNAPPVAAHREKRNFRHNFLLHDGSRVARIVDLRYKERQRKLRIAAYSYWRIARKLRTRFLTPFTGSRDGVLTSWATTCLRRFGSTIPGRQSPGNPTGPIHAAHQRTAPEISSPLEGAPAQPVFRGQVHQWTTARRPPKSSKIVQDRPTRKTPLRLASALRISFRLRDIRSGPRFFGEPTNVVGLVSVNVFTKLAAVHYLPGGHFAPRPCGRLALVLAERTPQQSNQGFASANPRRPSGEMALACGVSPQTSTAVSSRLR